MSTIEEQRQKSKEEQEQKSKEYWEKLLAKIADSGMTLREFCAKLGISEYSFSAMRKHCPSAWFLSAANKILDYDLSYIFDSTFPEPEHKDILKDYEKELINEIRKHEKKKRKDIAILITTILKSRRLPTSVVYGFISDETEKKYMFGNKDILNQSKVSRIRNSSSPNQPDLFTEIEAYESESINDERYDEATSSEATSSEATSSEA